MDWVGSPGDFVLGRTELGYPKSSLLPEAGLDFSTFLLGRNNICALVHSGKRRVLDLRYHLQVCQEEFRMLTHHGGTGTCLLPIPVTSTGLTEKPSGLQGSLLSSWNTNWESDAWGSRLWPQSLGPFSHAVLTKHSLPQPGQENKCISVCESTRLPVWG